MTLKGNIIFSGRNKGFTTHRVYTHADSHIYVVKCGEEKAGAVASMKLGEVKQGQVTSSETEYLSVTIKPPQRNLSIFTDH